MLKALWYRLALVASIAAGCSPDPAQPTVVLLSLDTLRADHLSCYGYDRATSPVIDTIADESIRFEDVVCQATATLPSHLSLLTSLNPPQFGITQPDGKNTSQEKTTLRLEDKVVTLAEVLRDHGYRTAAFTDGGFVGERYGFDQGFDHFEMNGYDHTNRYSGLKRVNAKLSTYLDRLSESEVAANDRPLFLFLHTYEVHAPYDAPSPFEAAFTDHEGQGTYDDFVHAKGFAPRPGSLKRNRARLTESDIDWVRGLYDNGIRAADSMVGELVELLRSHGLYESGHFILLSDHGEEFDDHGSFGHGPTVYQELVEVPLIWRLPGGRNGGTVRRGPFALLDVAPTLVDVLGIPPPSSFEGLSLRGLLEGGQSDEWVDQRRIYSDIANVLVGVAGLRRGSWKVVHSPTRQAVELYDLERDPQERRSLEDAEPERAKRLVSELRVWIAEMSKDAQTSGMLAVEHEAGGGLSEEERERLEALGYID